MVDDVISAVDALSNLDIIDSERIYCLGYSMGGTVGLYAAAIDKRIKGVVSVCGFSPFRLSNPEKEKENAIIMKYSHFHGLQPRLGFFVDAPKRMPFDFHEVLGLIAPRPVMIVAPELDWDNIQSDVIQCADEARKIYKLMNAEMQLELFAKYDINRFSENIESESPRKEVFEWIKKIFK
jgi:pimeloyl-ACP methyl ester carboxylesterase